MVNWLFKNTKMSHPSKPMEEIFSEISSINSVKSLFYNYTYTDNNDYIYC